MNERADFLETYLKQPQFKQNPPTQQELEIMGNYVLWGKDKDTGLNAKQAREVPLESRSKDWDRSSRCESLDFLMTTPTFNEANISGLDKPAIKVTRQVFSRKEALSKCPEYLRGDFEALFRQIDQIDLSIERYEIFKGKKDTMREALEKKFTREQIEEVDEQIKKWNQFTYLKNRHTLVELRRQQYTLRDGYSEVLQIGYNNNGIVKEMAPASIGNEIQVRPLGICNFGNSNLIFQDFDKLIPKNFGEEELRKIFDIVWDKEKIDGTYPVIDFCNPEHLYKVINNLKELKMYIDEEDLDKGMLNFLETFWYYVRQANLSEMYQEILEMKIDKISNVDIRYYINKKYGKKYSYNYISTILTQRIIPKIAEGARLHLEIVQNLDIPENFKKCSCCGRTFLRSGQYFTKKARSVDKFTNICKICEKKKRKGEI